MSVFNGNSGGTPSFTFGQPNGQQPPHQQNKSQPQRDGFGDPRRSNRRKNGPNNGGHNGQQNAGNYNSGASASASANGRRVKSKSSQNKPYVHQNGSGSSSSTHKGGATASPSDGSGYDSSDPLDVPKRVIPKSKPDLLQHHTQSEKEITGPIYANPAQLGFQPRSGARSARPRPIPKYLLHQPRVLETPEFQQDPWDTANQQKMLAMETAAAGKDYQGLYEEFQKMRDAERKQMEVLGLVDAENVSKDLNDAISFQGSCVEMCPIFERVRRALENNVKNLERDPSTGKISRERAIKAFSRPAAGQPPPLPSEVRPPHILVHTLNYLIENTLSHLPEAHSFIWDRTRSIRQDFTYQNFFGPEAIDCNEKIVRIHLLCLHVMAGAQKHQGVEYSQQQELEQFNKALQTLLEIYKDVRNHGGVSPNEAEFRAYYLLSHIRDPEQEREIQQLSSDILFHPYIQLALMFRNLVLQSNIVERGYHSSVSAGSLSLFEEFFRTVKKMEVPYLMSSLLETHFNEIRFYALKSMSRSYHTKSKPYPALKLQKFLGFDDLESTIKFVQYYEVDIIENGPAGEIYVDLFNKDKLENKYKLNSIHDKPKLSPAYSESLDQKFSIARGDNIRQLIDSGKSNHDLKLKSGGGGASSSVIRKASALAPGGGTPRNAFGAPPTGFTASAAPSSGNGSKSLSDFLSSGQPGNNGFASTPTGTPASAFGGVAVNNAIAKTFGKPDTPVVQSQPPKINSTGLFSQNGPSAAAPSNTTGTPAPAFSFSATKPAAAPFASSSNSGKTASASPASAPFNFGSTASPSQSSFNFSNEKKEAKLPPIQSQAAPMQAGGSSQTPSLSFLPKSQPQESKSFQLPSAAETAPATTIAPPPVVSVPVPVTKPKKPLLVESPYFLPASAQVYEQILSSVITSELSKILPNLVEQQHQYLKRSALIQDITKETYSKILGDLLKPAILEAQADAFYKKTLKRMAAKLFVKKGALCRQKVLLKEQKRSELESISFGSKRSRHGSHVSESAGRTKRIKLVPSVNYIDETQSKVARLWEPVDLKKFTSDVSSKIRIKLESKSIEFNFLLLIENWQSNYSKWLNNKLKLDVNKESMVYEKLYDTDKLKLKFTSLPPAANVNYDVKKYFAKTPFIIFECGKTMPNGGSLEEKLSSDKEKLTKLLKLLSGHSFYKVQLVLLYWDSSDAGLQPSTVLQKLGLSDQGEVSKDIAGDSIKSVEFVNMSGASDINERLMQVFRDLSGGFTGELTAKGRKKIEKLKRRISSAKLQAQRAADSQPQPPAAPANDPQAASGYKLKEQEQLSKAKALRKYDYLAKHISNSKNTSSSSFINNNNSTTNNNNPNNSSFVTAYNFQPSHNNSQYFPNTFLNNTTMFNDTTMINPNVSRLGGFGNGIVEQSTPFNSPGKSAIRKPNLANVPKGLQELRELTQGIKRKYGTDS